MPKSFLIRRRNSAQLRRRNWGEVSDQLRGDWYIPETGGVPAPISPTALSLSSSSSSAWDGGDPKRLHSQPPAVGSRLPGNQGRGLSPQGAFQCAICSKRFPLQRMLTRHGKSHSPLKKHPCIYCSKGFNDTFDLKRHLRTHTGIRPFRCCLCAKGFTQRCSLESHLKKIHHLPQNYGYRERREKLFVCEQCGFTCGTSDEYYGHTRRGHLAGPRRGEDFPRPGQPQSHLLLR